VADANRSEKGLPPGIDDRARGIDRSRLLCWRDRDRLSLSSVVPGNVHVVARGRRHEVAREPSEVVAVRDAVAASREPNPNIFRRCLSATLASPRNFELFEEES